MKITALGLAASLAAMLSAAPVWAQDAGTQTASAPAAQTAAQPDPKDTIVCKTLPPPTGSMIGGRRICATQGQWEAQSRSAQEAVERGMEHSRVSSGGGGGN